MKLLIGNKCYSSWSLRAWLLMRAKGLPFEEIMVLLDQPGFKDTIFRHAPGSGGTVPTLVDGPVAVYEAGAVIGASTAMAANDARTWLIEHGAPRRSADGPDDARGDADQ